MRCTRSNSGLRAIPKSALVVLLGWTGGAVDAMGYLVLYRLFTAQMSGNTLHLAVALGRHDLRVALERAAVIAAFIAGALFGALVIEIVKRRFPGAAFALTLGIEIVLLVTFWIVAAQASFAPRADSATYFALLALAAPAMAIQNVALRKVGGTVVHTTFVTGVIVVVCESLVNVVAARVFDGRRDAESEAALRVLLPVYPAYLSGGLAAALVFLARPVYAPSIGLVPLVGVWLYAAISRTPIFP